MKAWRCATAGGPADLALVDMPAPVLRQDEVLVRLAAGALNFSDLLMLNGTYQVRPDPPFIPGQEIAGVVVNDAGRFRRGDRVASKVFWGGFAEYVAVRQDMAIDLPPEFEFAEGACLPVIHGRFLRDTFGQDALRLDDDPTGARTPPQAIASARCASASDLGALLTSPTPPAPSERRPDAVRTTV